MKCFWTPNRIFLNRLLPLPSYTFPPVQNVPREHKHGLCICIDRMRAHRMAVGKTLRILWVPRRSAFPGLLETDRILAPCRDRLEPGGKTVREHNFPTLTPHVYLNAGSKALCGFRWIRISTHSGLRPWLIYSYAPSRLRTWDELAAGTARLYYISQGRRPIWWPWG